MTFTSFAFLIIFPLIILVYNLIPRVSRQYFLLAASYVIYGFLQPMYLILLILTSCVTYSFGLWIDRTDSDNMKRHLKVVGILLVLAPLLLFKYFNSIGELMMSLGISVSFPTIRWMLPLGISYYTFMAIGYLADIYNEEFEAANNPCSVALLLSFFPIVFSGPIERAGNMFPQFSNMKNSSPQDLTAGFKMMLWGYFMKLCVADRLGIYISAVYGNVAMHNGNTLGLAALLFPIQEYADLGGYSLIAIGAARCLGFKIIPNFRRPFFSTSISSFWRRWHMSLIQWLTDYIYTPMAYILRSWKAFGVVGALMVTFLVSGVWHGATLTCVVWGLAQGVLLSIESLTLKNRTLLENKFGLTKKWWYSLGCMVIVYLIFAFSEIYGMSRNISDANLIVQKIFLERGELFWDTSTMRYAIVCLLLLFVKDFSDEFLNGRYSLFNNSHIVVRWGSYLGLIVLIMLFGVLDGGAFIYFQF